MSLVESSSSANLAWIAEVGGKVIVIDVPGIARQSD